MGKLKVSSPAALVPSLRIFLGTSARQTKVIRVEIAPQRSQMGLCEVCVPDGCLVDLTTGLEQRIHLSSRGTKTVVSE